MRRLQLATERQVIMKIPFSCDTSVALGSATFDGSTILAKNSDRPPNEAQPLIHVPRRLHPAGSTAKCQYIEIPQSPQTWELIGSRPCWLWGFEMGVNEWGVVIGNEAVHTREPDEEVALIGMDLVRLGLERGTSAEESVVLIGDLIERYGQGGSCDEFAHRTYHNSFIVADPASAWIVETAGHYWAAKRVENRGAISNVLTIGESGDKASPGLADHAAERGWATDPFDFAESYRDPAHDRATGMCRLERARAMLGGYRKPITVRDMMAVLSDHDGRDLPVRAEPLPTLCMHACPGFMGETAASMVAHVRPGKPRELTATVWTAFGSPCLSVFRPVYPFAVGLLQELDTGSSTFSADSPWWKFERLQRMAAANPSLATPIRSVYAPLQEQFFADAAEAESKAEQLLATGNAPAAQTLLREIVDDTTRRALALTESLTYELLSNAKDAENPVMSAFWNEINESAKMFSFA